MPAKDTDAFIEASKYLPAMDCVTQGDGPVKGDTVLDIDFANVNPVIHVPASVLGVSSMENWSLVYGNEPNSYSMYSHGLCPSICEVQYQFQRHKDLLCIEYHTQSSFKFNSDFGTFGHRRACRDAL